KQIELAAGSLAFTYCQVPVVYTIAEENSISVVRMYGDVVELDLVVSEEVFGRSGLVERIEVKVMVENLK
ncbi:MAG: hypothetical protein AB8G11_18825, partial [Saprospiraceae bacterium]